MIYLTSLRKTPEQQMVVCAIPRTVFHLRWFSILGHELKLMVC